MTGETTDSDNSDNNFKRLQQQTLISQQQQQQHKRHASTSTAMPVPENMKTTGPQSHSHPASPVYMNSDIPGHSSHSLQSSQSQQQQQQSLSSHSAPQSPQLFTFQQPSAASLHVQFAHDPSSHPNHSNVSLSPSHHHGTSSTTQIPSTLITSTSPVPQSANIDANQHSLGADSVDSVPLIVATAGLTTGTTSGTNRSAGGAPLLLGNQQLVMHETTRSTGSSVDSHSGNTITSNTTTSTSQQPLSANLLQQKYAQGSSISGTFLNASTIEQMTQHMVKNSTIEESERIIDVSPSGRYAKLNVLLGKGAHKVVYKCIDREEGYECAWNTVQTTKAEFNELSPEIEILKRVRHPNIINFHDCWYNNGEFIFITELMTSGTLREYIRKLQTPNYKVIKRWCRQILKGLLYLHSHDPPIIHRDIKCDNIFINGAHGEVKIGDMGTAEMKFGKKYTVIGTPEFMAPEMYEERGYNEKVDVYAFGMCLLEMVTGEYPYTECTNAAQIYKRVTAGIKPDGLNKVTDPEIYDLVCRCLADENERITVQQGLEHPFLAVEPEVVLLLANENKTQLTLQVVFKGMDKLSAKFEFNTETDTAEEVVREMIEENVLPQKFQTLITHEINRILRDLNKLASDLKKEEKAPWRRSDAIVKDELERTRRELQMMHDRAAEAEKKAELLEVRARLAEEKNKSFAPSAPVLLPATSVPVVGGGAAGGGAGSTQQSTGGGVGGASSNVVPAPPPTSSSQATVVSPNTSTADAQSTSAISPATDTSASHPPLPSATVSSNTQPSSESLTILTSSLPRPGIQQSTQQQSTQQQSIQQQPTSHSLLLEEAVAPPIKEYRDDQPIDDLVRDTALANNRGQDKAHEWLQRLQAQDIMTVGDLRDLHEQDWGHLGLTVFASRALRNALLGKGPRNISPKTHSKSMGVLVSNSGGGGNTNKTGGEPDTLGTEKTTESEDTTLTDDPLSSAHPTSSLERTENTLTTGTLGDRDACVDL